MNKKVDEKTMSTFEATMRACQESKNKTQKKLIKESNKITEAAEDDIDAGIDDFDDFDDEVVDFDGNPLEGESLPEDTFDDVAVIIDPELDPEQVSNSIDELQQLIDETPDGEVPTSDEYVGDYTYTCPICGNKFFNDTELAEGSECPVCGETPEAFILMGEVSKIDDTEDKEEEPKDEEPKEDESTEEEVEEVEEIEESKKVCKDDDCDKEEDKAEKKEESAQQLELDSKPVWTPPKRSDKRPKVKKVTKDNALKAERARRRARALRRARRMEQMRKNRRVRPSTRRRVENRRRPISKRQVEARRRTLAKRRLESVRRSSSKVTRKPVRRTPMSRRVESRQFKSRRAMNRRRQVEQRRPVRKGMNLEEKSFNKLLTRFVTENYKNIESMEVSKARISKGTLTLECVLNKKDESKVNANIVIENFRFRNGYGRFTCDVDKVFSPKTEAKTKNTFVVECKKIGSIVKCTGFRYNFITESKSGTYRVSGKCM